MAIVPTDIKTWLSESCEQKTGWMEHSAELFENWDAYRAKNDLFPITKKRLSINLALADFQRTRGSRGERMFLDMRLRD